MLESIIQLTSRNVSNVYNFAQSSKQGNFFRSQYFYVLVFHQKQLIKDASMFRLCTAVNDTTHREQGSDQVWGIPCKGLGPERPPPFLASLFCRLWLHACSEGQFPRNTFPFLMLVIKYIFLHSSTKIWYWPTAQHTKAFLFPAVHLLIKIRPLAHFYFPTLPHWGRRTLFYFCHLTQPHLTNSQILLKQPKFLIPTYY